MNVTMLVAVMLFIGLVGCRSEQSNLSEFVASSQTQSADKLEFSLPVLTISPLIYQEQGSPFSLPNNVLVPLSEQKDHCRPNTLPAPIAIKVGEHSLKGVVLRESQPIALVELADGQLVGREVGQVLDSRAHFGVITEIRSQGVIVAHFDTDNRTCVVPSIAAAPFITSVNGGSKDKRSEKQGVEQ